MSNYTLELLIGLGTYVYHEEEGNFSYFKPFLIDIYNLQNNPHNKGDWIFYSLSFHNWKNIISQYKVEFIKNLEYSGSGVKDRRLAYSRHVSILLKGEKGKGIFLFSLVATYDDPVELFTTISECYKSGSKGKLNLTDLDEQDFGIITNDDKVTIGNITDLKYERGGLVELAVIDKNNFELELIKVKNEIEEFEILWNREVEPT
jgi:hypothetical protein